MTDNESTGGSNESPAFSPTGRHLAFTSTRTGSMQIFVIGRDGRGERQITTNRQQPDPVMVAELTPDSWAGASTFATGYGGQVSPA